MFLRSLCSLLAVIDHKKCFIELIVNWSISVEDERVFVNLFLKANLEKLLNNLLSISIVTCISSTSHETQHENILAFILANSICPSTSRIMPIFKNNECNCNRDIKKLNIKLIDIRYYIENAFDICKELLCWECIWYL